MTDIQKRPYEHREEAPKTPSSKNGQSDKDSERLIPKELGNRLPKDLPEELPGDPMMTRNKVDDLFSK